MQRACLVRLGLLLAFVGTGCTRPGLVVVQDLVEELPAAELSGTPTTILFGTPAAQAYEERGLARSSAGNGERFSWANRQAQLKLHWAEVLPRAAALDLSPAPGLRRQSLDVRMNGGHVARLRFRSRARFLIDLPTKLQKAGDNRLSLSFGRASASPAAGTPRAARLHSLSVDATAGSSLAALAEKGSLPVVEAVRTDGEPSLVQMSGNELRYAVRLPPGAELRTQPSVAGSSRSSAQLSIAIEDTPDQLRELWRRALKPGERIPEIHIGLSAFSGRSVRLLLRVEAAGPAWAAWGAPRVLAPAPPATPPNPRAHALASSLLGSNVVLVVLDAGGARHFSCYGYARTTTPEMDAIASEGVLFERAYTPGVYTLAAMGSLWTSRPPEECSPAGRGLSRLPGSPPTLAERLTGRGIRSAGFVANARAGRAYGMDRGFTEFREVLRDGVGRAEGLREAVDDWLRKAPATPFFLYVHFREPHFPYDPPPPFDTRFGPVENLPAAARREQAWIEAVNSGRAGLSPPELDELTRLYDGNLAYADSEIGTLRKTLEALGLWDRSVVIITGDHGEAFREHGYIGHNRQVHAESAHIPLLVRFPRGRGPAGVRVEALSDLLDVAPTVAEILGVQGDGSPAGGFVGMSLLPLALGGSGRGFVVTRNATGERAGYAIRDGSFTLIRSLRYTQERLFDAVQDPEERNDLASNLPLEAAYARARLFLWLARLRPEPAPEGAPELTAEQREQLRALGYIN